MLADVVDASILAARAAYQGKKRPKWPQAARPKAPAGSKANRKVNRPSGDKPRTVMDLYAELTGVRK